MHQTKAKEIKHQKRSIGMRSRIILVPFPAQGHVTPMLQLARVLHARGFEVTVAAPDFIHRRLAPRAGDDDWVRFASIPSGLVGDNTSPDFAAISSAMESCMPAHFERLLSSGDVACVVVDLVASWAIPVARRLGVPVAGFWPAMLARYRIILAIPELIRSGFISEFGSPLCQQPHSHECNQEEQAAEDLKLAGQPKLRTKDLPWLVGNPASQKLGFMIWLRILERAKTLQWLLVNSFPGEEGHHHSEGQYMQLEHDTTPQALPIGPLIAHDTIKEHSNPSLWEEDHSCLEWLQKQPPNSVVYVSFGSWVAPISPEKITEFALGLEAAGQPFLWSLKDEKSWRAGLPGGYLDRIAGHGKVVAWAPQEEVLRSPAIGCYISHCGWNSTLEAILHEKKLLCYPIAGDQFVNAAYIVNVWGAGLSLDGCDRHGIEEGIKRIMKVEEDAKIQDCVVQLKRRILMGCKGNCSKAMENLQCFVDVIKKGIM